MDLTVTQSMLKNTNQAVHRGYDRSFTTKNRINSSIGLKLIDNMSINEDDSHQEDNFIMIKSLVEKANQKFDEVVNSYNIKRPYTTNVKFYIVFLRVGEIDNVKERFQADAYIESFWEDESLNNVKKFDPLNHWEPEIFVANAMGNLKTDVKYRLEKLDKTTRVYEMRRVKGFFWEKLELGNFPLDDQDLSITISSSRSKDEVQFDLSTEHECSINTEGFQQQQEWLLFTNIQSEKKVIYDIFKDYERSAYTISSKIARKPGYFLNNAYMLIFMISILGFVPFAFACTLPHFRIQTTLLLILSSANFRWVVSQRLPSISYLTILDKYAITALIYLVLLCIWHSIIGSNLFLQYTYNDRNRIDNILLFTIAGLFIGSHVVYISYFLFKFLRYRKLEEPQDKKKNDDVELGYKKEDRTVSDSQVKPSTKILVPQNKDQIAINGDIKYRNFLDSPNDSALKK